MTLWERFVAWIEKNRWDWTRGPYIPFGPVDIVVFISGHGAPPASAGTHGWTCSFRPARSAFNGGCCSASTLTRT